MPLSGTWIITKNNIPTSMVQIFGHLYETMFLILMCNGNFPEYRAFKAAWAVKNQNKESPFQSFRCSLMALGILQKSGIIRVVINSGIAMMSCSMSISQDIEIFPSRAHEREKGQSNQLMAFPKPPPGTNPR